MASVNPVTRGNYRRYTREQKERAVQLSHEHSLAHASDMLKIPKSSIVSWRKTMAATGTIVDAKCNIGLKLTYDEETDLKIRDWVLLQRHRNLPVTRAGLMEYARQAVDRPGFKATDGWLRHFLRRHQLSLRARTTVAQQQPEDLARRIDVFNTYLREQRLDTAFDHIINMDETAVFFDSVPTRTIAQKGEKTVTIRTTGAEKRHLTVVLAIAANGHTLPPLVIFKGKRWPSDVRQVPEGVHMKMQEKGWMDERLMLSWVTDVLLPHTARKPALLVLDSFAAHITPDVREKLTQSGVTIAVIPGGCTSKIQPLDVSINKPFKDHLRASWIRYMQESDHASTRIKTASRQKMLEWVSDAWTHISEEGAMVAKSFDVCGISDALRGAVEERRRQTEGIVSAFASDDSRSFDGFSSRDVPASSLDDDRENPFLFE